MAQYKLHYFSGRMRAEFIRYILHYAGVRYEEVVLEWDDWHANLKQKSPMGILPILEIKENGKKLTQSMAITRYLAKKRGLTSSDDFQDAWGDQLASFIEDIHYLFYTDYCKIVYFDKTESKIKAAWENMRDNGVIPLFTRYEKLLEQKWFCADKIHYCDIVIAEFVDRIEKIFEPGLVKSKFPKLHAHWKRVHEIPKIKEYVEKRPAYQF